MLFMNVGLFLQICWLETNFNKQRTVKSPLKTLSENRFHVLFHLTQPMYDWLSTICGLAVFFCWGKPFFLRVFAELGTIIIC